MTNSSDENEDGTGISDEALPDDLTPSEDNPLAEGLDAGETAGDLDPGELLDEGKQPDQWDDNDAERGDGGDGGSVEG